MIDIGVTQQILIRHRPDRSQSVFIPIAADERQNSKVQLLRIEIRGLGNKDHIPLARIERHIEVLCAGCSTRDLFAPPPADIRIVPAQVYHRANAVPLQQSGQAAEMGLGQKGRGLQVRFAQVQAVQPGQQGPGGQAFNVVRGIADEEALA